MTKTRIVRAALAHVVAACERAASYADDPPTHVLLRGKRVKLNNVATVVRFCRGMGRARTERLVLICLDAQDDVLDRQTVTVGELNTVRTHPREIFRPAILAGALGIILVHNHPSGCLEPSTEDVEFTKTVKRAGELIGVRLYDHVIVAGNAGVSMRERGLLG